MTHFNCFRVLANKTQLVCAVTETGWGRLAISKADCRHASEIRDPQGPAGREIVVRAKDPGVDLMMLVLSWAATVTRDAIPFPPAQHD
jgi:hypothetical protein